MAAKQKSAKRTAKGRGRKSALARDKSVSARKTTARKTSRRPAGKAREKDPRGGLTAAGRKAFAEKEGAHLKPGVTKKESEMTPQDMRRKGSWAVRFHGRAKLPPLVDRNGRPTHMRSRRMPGASRSQDCRRRTADRQERRAAAAALSSHQRTGLARFCEFQRQPIAGAIVVTLPIAGTQAGANCGAPHKQRADDRNIGKTRRSLIIARSLSEFRHVRLVQSGEGSRMRREMPDSCAELS